MLLFILDHRILIPKSPEKIWEFLSDISNNPSWQVDCTDISLLTNKRSGAGIRWRYTTTGGRSFVVETTAWYDGLGYEYTFVDGAPFKESKGRIRLQEIAEGTVVQWTLTYETGGVLAGFRNAVGLKRQFESAMVDSLKNLWKVLQKVMPEDKPREVKSLMRDAPDYESRTHYRPRHPSKTDEQSPPVEQGISAIVEPPISLEDTRPRAPVRVEVPPVVPEPESPEVAEALRSEFAPPLSEIVEDSSVSEFAASLTPVEAPDEVQDPFAPAAEVTTSSWSSEVPPVSRVTTQEATALPPEPTVKPPPPTPERRTLTQEARIVSAEPEREVTPASPSTPPLPSSPDTVKMATSEMSVFELFGIPRPSQTQEIQPVESFVDARPELAAPEVVIAQPARLGLRLVLRRKRVKIRRPA